MIEPKKTGVSPVWQSQNSVWIGSRTWGRAVLANGSLGYGVVYSQSAYPRKKLKIIWPGEKSLGSLKSQGTWAGKGLDGLRDKWSHRTGYTSKQLSVGYLPNAYL